ncbi:MAG TPA: hypothetical protein VN329_12905, partial [Roseomonas sp.]|nr:hypothetical protein [Roseomonas sp.]
MQHAGEGRGLGTRAGGAPPGFHGVLPGRRHGGCRDIPAISAGARTSARAIGARLIAATIALHASFDEPGITSGEWPGVALRRGPSAHPPEPAQGAPQPQPVPDHAGPPGQPPA